MILQSKIYKSPNKYETPEDFAKDVFGDEKIQEYIGVYQKFMNDRMERNDVLYRSSILRDEGSSLEVIRLWLTEQALEDYNVEISQYVDKPLIDDYLSSRGIEVEEILKEV